MHANSILFTSAANKDGLPCHFVSSVDDAFGFQDPSAGLVVSVHLHHVGVDHGVNDNPSATMKLSVMM